VTAQVLDFAYGRPRPEKIKGLGYEGVIRYLCQDEAKRLTRPELVGYIDASLSVALVYEDGAQDVLAGAPLGAVKGEIAKAQLAELNGFPPGRPIYIAVDFEIGGPREFASALDFAKAFILATGGGRPFGFYGPRPFLAYASKFTSYLWETGASSWNIGATSPACLFQQAVGAVVDKAAVDVNHVPDGVLDWGQFAVLMPTS